MFSRCFGRSNPENNPSGTRKPLTRSASVCAPTRPIPSGRAPSYYMTEGQPGEIKPGRFRPKLRLLKAKIRALSPPTRTLTRRRTAHRVVKGKDYDSKKTPSSQYEGLPRDYIAGWRTRRLDSRNRLIAPSETRSAFAELEFTLCHFQSASTHKDAAAERNSIFSFAVKLGSRIGKRPYMVNASSADQRHNADGHRDYHWAKDMNVKPQHDGMRHSHMAVFVDDDYHMDMPAILLRLARPCLIYTIQPTEPAGVMNDSQYWFKDNELHMLVRGGAMFGAQPKSSSHIIWDYSGDCLTFTGKVWGHLNTSFTWRSVTYLVERKQLSFGRQLILLSPITRHDGLLDTYLTTKVAGTKGKTLTQFKPLNHEGWNVITSVTDERESAITRMSVSRNGAMTAATITTDEYVALKEHFITNSRQKLGVTATSLNTHLRCASKVTAQVFLSYLQASVDNDYSQLCFIGLMRYQCKVPGRRAQFYNEDYKPSVQVWCNPLIGPAAAPDRCPANDTAAYIKRILLPQTNVFKNMSANPDLNFILETINYFIHMITHVEFGDIEGTMHPASYEEVSARQARPTQQALLQREDCCDLFPDPIWGYFEKGDPAGKYADPRGISVSPTKEKIDHSSYMYPVMDLFQRLNWYAFGKTPRAIAEGVARVCDGAAYMNEDDIVRMDGHENDIGRIMTRGLMLGLYAPEHHQELETSLKDNYHVTAKSTWGLKFKSGFTRSSGSSQTTFFNTSEIFLVHMAAYRSMINPATVRYYTKEEAYLMTRDYCMFGGDDGLARELSADALTAGARKCRHYVTQIKREPGSNPTFLARVYGPDVFSGDPTSCWDPKRQLTKFHTCKVNNAPPERKLVEKLFSLAATDANTPIAGELVDTLKRVIRRMQSTREGLYQLEELLGVGFKKVGITDTNFYAVDEVDQRWPNERAEWMYDVMRDQLPGLHLSNLFDALQDCNTLQDMLTLPPVVADPIEPALGAAVLLNPPGGEIISEAARKEEKNERTHEVEDLTKVPDPDIELMLDQARQLHEGGKISDILFASVEDVYERTIPIKRALEEASKTFLANEQPLKGKSDLVPLKPKGEDVKKSAAVRSTSPEGSPLHPPGTPPDTDDVKREKRRTKNLARRKRRKEEGSKSSKASDSSSTSSEPRGRPREKTRRRTEKRRPGKPIVTGSSGKVSAAVRKTGASAPAKPKS